MTHLRLVLLLVVAGFTVKAQSIRKDYREFTAQEQASYIAAINALSAPGKQTIQNIAASHRDHFSTNIHSSFPGDGSQFLSWHRFFLVEFEQYIKTATTGSGELTIPYWDWTTDNDKTAAAFWNNGFLKLTNFTNLAITRSNMTAAFPSAASTAEVNAVMAINNFLVIPESNNNPDFSHKLERGAHNTIHSYIGGTMGGSNSPLDPVFFLHHAMVDKLWQNWEDNTTAIQSVFPGSIGTTALVHYDAHHYAFNVYSNNMVDSRNITRPANAGAGRKVDVWYAANKKVVLDGANGVPFICSDLSKPYTYKYMAATGSSTIAGSIFVGDVKRDGTNNIVADNKGGFQVNTGVSCNFQAGAAVSFLPGFEAKKGSIVDTRVITAVNAVREAQTGDELQLNAPANPIAALHVLPNPFTAQTTLQYTLPEQQTVSLTIQDMSGRVVLTVLSAQVNTAGTHAVVVEGDALTDGIYLAVLTTAHGTVAERLIKQ